MENVRIVVNALLRGMEVSFRGYHYRMDLGVLVVILRTFDNRGRVAGESTIPSQMSFTDLVSLCAELEPHEIKSISARYVKQEAHFGEIQRRVT